MGNDLQCMWDDYFRDVEFLCSRLWSRQDSLATDYLPVVRESLSVTLPALLLLEHCRFDGLTSATGLSDCTAQAAQSTSWLCWSQGGQFEVPLYVVHRYRPSLCSPEFCRSEVSVLYAYSRLQGNDGVVAPVCFAQKDLAIPSPGG